jgi:TolA-binding protein
MRSTLLMMCAALAPLATGQAQGGQPPVPTRPPATVQNVIPLAPLRMDIAPQLQAAALQLQAVAPQLEATQLRLQAMQPELREAMSQIPMAELRANLSALSDLSGLSRLSQLQIGPEIQMAMSQLATALPAIADVSAVSIDEDDLPPRAWNPEDPADSLYQSAREAFNDEDYSRAASLFREITRRYPKSTYAADAPYWEAFALYRDGGQSKLNRALAVLKMQHDRYPKAATRRDAATLTARIRGELAKLGDADQAAAVAEMADATIQPGRVSGRNGTVKGGGMTLKANTLTLSTRDTSACAEDEDNDIRMVALNALLQMNSERALPILKQVLARRGACTEGLRRKAVFLVAQKAHSDEGASILLDVARTDPDPEVKQQAIFWLSQVPGDRAIAALDSVLRTSTDPDLQEKAIFALSQHKGDRATKILRDYAESNDAPEELRAKAIFWIGQMDGGKGNTTGAYLRDLYGRVQSQSLKERIIQAAALSGGSANASWLLGIAKDRSAPIELRKKALFWAAQQDHTPLNDLLPLYTTLGDKEMKEYFIYALSQRSEPAALDKLIDIAKNDPDADMRKKAILWLGQKDDPRVQQLLLDIINR